MAVHDTEMEHYLMFYQVHAAQARAHEDQRATMTNILVAVATVLIGVIVVEDFERSTIAASIVLVVIGALGVLFSLKHYERNRFHAAIMRSIQRHLDDAESSPRTLQELRTRAAELHYRKFPDVRRDDEEERARRAARFFVSRWHLHWFWIAPPVLIWMAGVILTIWIALRDAPNGLPA